MSLQSFIIIITFIVTAVFGFIVSSKKHGNFSIKSLTFSSLCISLAFVLSHIRLFSLPQGGFVTPGSMFFITVIGFWFGLRAGIISGITFGALMLITNPFIVHPFQLLLDYPLAFGSLGVSGLFRSKKYGLYIGYIVACTGRWFFATLSGILFFYMYAGDANPILFSATYNMSYILPEMLITLVIISVPTFKKAIYSFKF